jgi:hypothetical protein
MGGGGQRGPLGTTINKPVIDGGTLNSHASPMPGPVGFKAPPAGDVRVPPKLTEYHPGVKHNHKPSGRWDEVGSRSGDGFWVCRHESFEHAANAAINNEVVKYFIAFQHVGYYMQGSGEDFDENENIDKWLRSDMGIRWALKQAIPWSRKTKTYSDHFEFLQPQYDEDQEEFQYSFGAIDRVDFEVDFDQDTIHVWFQDCYEWHPYYPGIYDVQPGDSDVRDTNCIHAAFVEMKSKGAKDYWMKGEATVPLPLIRSAIEPDNQKQRGLNPSAQPAKPGEGGAYGH